VGEFEKRVSLLTDKSGWWEYPEKEKGNPVHLNNPGGGWLERTEGVKRMIGLLSPPWAIQSDI